MKTFIGVRGSRSQRSVSFTMKIEQEELLVSHADARQRVSRINQNSNSEIVAQTSQSSSRVYTEQKYRFVILAVFSYAGFMMTTLGYFLSPIGSIINEQYGMSYNMINYYYNVCLIEFIPFTLVSNFLIDKLKIRKTLIIASFVTTVGCWLRLCFNSSQITAFIGQILCGAFFTCFLILPTRISVIWFKPQSRVMASSCMVILTILGGGLGSLLPSLIVKQGDAFSKNQITTLALIEAILLSSAFLFLLLFYRQAPKQPPSAVSSSTRLPLGSSIQKLFKSKRFILTLIAYTLAVGAVNAYLGLVEQILNSYGYQNSTLLSSIIINGQNISGIFGSFLFAYIADKIQKVKIIFLLMGFTSALFYGLITWTMEMQNYWIVICLNLGFGFFYNAFFTLGIQFVAEEAHPVSEQVSGGVMQAFNSLLGFGLVYLSSYLFDLKAPDYQNAAYLINLIFFGFFLLAGFFILCVKEKRKRSQEELAAAQSSTNSQQ